MIAPRLFSVILILTLISAGLVGGARLLGRSDSLPSSVLALLPDDSCAAPCWQGLRPGYWTEGEIRRWLSDPPHGWEVVESKNRSGHSAYLWYVIRQHGGKSINLTLLRTANTQDNELALAPHDLRLGDLLSRLGQPRYYNVLVGQKYLVLLHFPDNSLTVVIAMPQGDSFLSPELPVYVLAYSFHPWDALLHTKWNGPMHLSEFLNGRGTP
ncbi:MAG: hypothetical protein HY866_07665 [Chloroflexi bacterium]|nr:hypothetical protein [Chloroflexota bacterium]